LDRVPLEAVPEGRADELRIYLDSDASDSGLKSETVLSIKNYLHVGLKILDEVRVHWIGTAVQMLPYVFPNYLIDEGEWWNNNISSNDVSLHDDLSPFCLSSGSFKICLCPLSGSALGSAG
jgi:hypothetical protein